QTRAEQRSCLRRLEARETTDIPLVTCTPIALALGRRDFTNSVCVGPVCRLRPSRSARGLPFEGSTSHGSPTHTLLRPWHPAAAPPTAGEGVARLCYLGRPGGALSPPSAAVSAPPRGAPGRGHAARGPGPGVRAAPPRAGPGDDPVPASAGGAGGLARGRAPGGGGAAHGRREDLPGAARHARHPTEHPDCGADAGPDAPVVCASPGGLPRCPGGAARRRGTRPHPAAGGHL